MALQKAASALPPAAEECPLSYGSVPAPVKAQAKMATVGSMPIVCLSILIVECCERLAFYTLTGTQEFFLERLGYTVAQAGGLNAAMGTLCMAWALFAGWTADVVLGRYNTILVFGVIYAVGAAMAAVAALPALQSAKLYMFGVMVLVPFGTAGIKANISNFGADQYDTSDPAQAAAQEKFFSWFYMSINLGSAVAYGYLTTLGSSGGLGIPKRYGYCAVYIITAACMVAAVGVFRSKRTQYRMQPPQKRSALGSVSSRVLSVARQGSHEASSVCVGMLLIFVGVASSVIQAMAPEASFTSALTKLAFACAALGIFLVVLPCRSPAWVRSEGRRGGDLLDGDARDYSDEDVQNFLRLLPLLFTANLAFSAVYNSMQFWYQQQACQMDLRIGGTQLAGSFFCIADCLGIVIATPLAVDWLNPHVERQTGGRFGHGAKYGLGMAFAAVSVLLAARYEAERRLSPVLDVDSNCAPPGVKMSAMSASWMFGPFFIMGLGEIYTQPVLMHLSYSQSPKSMRTLTAATGLVIGAVSNALFTLQVAALAPFVPNDLNNGRLEIGYYGNVILGAVFYMGYLAMLRGFEEKKFRA
jgi:peptide/histidine transporter 3/4